MMVPVIPGHIPRVIAVAATPEELNLFEPQEQSLPEFGRVVLEIPLDPSEDISAIAQQIEEACIANSIPTWPEYPTHTFVEGNTIYVAYQKQAYQAQIAHLIPIIIGIILIAPTILWFCSETFREIIQLIIFIPLMFLMMSMMKSMTEGLKPGPKKPKEKLPPIEERIDARLERLGSRIARIGGLFRTSASAGVGEVTSVASEISGIARSVKAAPETVVSSYNKAKSAKEMSALTRKLEEYEARLTPRQKEKLASERGIVEELRAMYP